MPIKANAITPDARALWLRLRTDGGWWTLDMLVHHCKPGCALCEVQHAMDALEANGFVESRDHATNLRYGVTSNCKSLPGHEHPANAPEMK